MNSAGGNSGGRLDEVQDPSAAGNERRVIQQDPVNVVSPADGIEVVALVVVERRLLPQPPVHRVGIHVDLGIEGVVVHIALTNHRHVDVS